MLHLEAPAPTSVPCDYCGKQIDKRELRQHQAYECAQSELRIVSCPKGCGQNIEARNIEKHVQNECPLELVPCDFQLSGCPRRMHRRAKTEHDTENIQYHLGLINKGSMMRDERMAKLEKMLRAREVELQSLYTALDLERKERSDMFEEFEERMVTMLERFESKNKESADNSKKALQGSILTTNNFDTMRRTVDGLTLEMQNVQKEQLDMSIRVRRVQTLQSEQQASQGGRGWDAVGSTGPPLNASLSTTGGFRGPDATGGDGGLMTGEDSLSHAHPHAGQEIVSLGQPFGAPVDTILRVNMHEGPYFKIQDAIRAARVGDRIKVSPGRYQETLCIDHPLELHGDGHVTNVIVESSGKDTLVFETSYGVVARITFRQRGTGFWNCIDCMSGNLNLEQCDISSQSLTCISVHKKESRPRIWRNRIHDCGGVGLYIYDGATATVNITGPLPYDSANATIEDNEIYNNGQSGIEISEAANPEICFNRIRDNAQHGVLVHDNGKGELRDNEIFKNNLAGIEVRESGNLKIVRNKIYQHESSGGIYVHHYGRATIEKNDVYRNSLSGITVWKSGKPICKQNRISRNGEYGIHVKDGGWGTFEENDVRSNGRGGLLITADSQLKVVQGRNLID